MTNAFTHSRAAILCLGGWGLQTLFHLAPRLRATQEQRVALGVTNADLSRITSFTALLPEPLLDADGQAQFYVRGLRNDQPIPPLYIEKWLAKLDNPTLHAFDNQTAGLLTAAEKRAILLQQATEELLQPLDLGEQPFTAPAKGLAPGQRHNSQPTARRVTRADLFRTALTHGDRLARLLEIHALDPIRQDNLVEDDPFVQTTLYVVAPLFEPLVSSLIWPLTAALIGRAGRRQISQVVALLATGSYATDLTRSPIFASR